MSDFAEQLIARLALGLESANREPFRLAAEAALAAAPPALRGPGSDYRTVERVWRKFFVAPQFGSTTWDGGPRQRTNKLITEGKRAY